MSATLDFEIEESNGIQVIHISGPLDSQTYNQCKDYLDPIINHSGANVVLDCQNLTYVNSRGITLLMQYQRIATQSFSFFGIAAFRPHILKGIERLGLGKLLTWYPTIEKALDTASASA